MDIIIGVLLLLILGMVLRSCWEQKHFEISEYPVYHEKLNDMESECRLVVLTDLHSGCFGKKNERLLTAILDSKPQAILIVGDMYIGKPKEDTTIAREFVLSLAKRFPVYYANGNHEYRTKIDSACYGDIYAEYEQALKEQGVIFLENAKEVFRGLITIYGLEIDQKYYQKRHTPVMEPDYLLKELGKLDNQKYNILLAHNPQFFENYAEWGADLILSGHNHGGIVSLPKIGGVIGTNYQLFPKYDKGVYKKGSSQMILSRGLGTHTIPFRLFNRPELIVLKLAGEKTHEN